jgi:Flp pilus assembly protein TadG
MKKILLLLLLTIAAMGIEVSEIVMAREAVKNASVEEAMRIIKG